MCIAGTAGRRAPVLALAIGAIACTGDAPGNTIDSADRRGAACVLPDSTPVATGDTILLQETAYPCIVTVTRTPVAILPDTAGNRPDPRHPIVRTTDGRFYTAAQSEAGRVLVWRADGSFERGFGRPGSGPGELGGSYLALIAGQRGELYVRTMGRWTVFAPDGALRHTIASSMAGDLNGVVILDDGAIVTSRPSGRGSFHVVRPGSTGVKSFGTVPSSDDPAAVPHQTRLIAAGGGGTFWAIPAVGTGAGYVLEQWDTTGKVRRTLRRDVTWYPRGRDIPGRPSSDPRARNDAWSGGRPPNALTAIQTDETGLLYVYARVTKPTWRLEFVPSSIPGEGGRQAWEVKYDSLHYETRLDVIDPDRGTVLVSTIVSPSHRQFPGSRFAYESGTDSDGALTARILELVLTRWR